MSVFDNAVASAIQSVGVVAGIPVTYHRDSAWVKLTAIPGKSDFRISEADSITVKERSRDYLFTTCFLRINGQTVTPKKGDEIKETVGNTVHTYEVLRPDGGDQVWRYSDPGRSVIRVHTKLKAVTAK